MGITSLCFSTSATVVNHHLSPTYPQLIPKKLYSCYLHARPPYDRSTVPWWEETPGILPEGYERPSVSRWGGGGSWDITLAGKR